jgi:pSer/pThr/pTyr-binding forkhead associated (FHA) protein
MTDVTCRSCSKPMPNGSRFCPHCGVPVSQRPPSTDTTGVPIPSAELPGGAEDGGEFVAELAPGVAMLVVRQGPGAGNRFLLDTPSVSIGRSEDSTILLDDITVSRRHAELILGTDGYSVTDVGSLNGTYLNRHRIDKGTLANGDELQIGKFRLTFLSAGRWDVPDAPASP